MKYINKSHKKPTDQPNFFKSYKQQSPNKIGNIFLKSLIVTLIVFLCFVAVSFIFKIKSKTEKLPAEACFLNFNISQFSRDDIEEFLKNQIQPQIDKLELNIQFNGRDLNISASDFNFHYDHNNFFNTAKKTNFDKNELFNPKMVFDEEKLHNLLNDFSQTTKTAPSPYSYHRNGEVLTVSAGKDGRIFNVDENYKNIVSAFSEFKSGPLNAVYETINSPNKEINFNNIKSKIDCEAKDATYVRESNGKTRVEKEQLGLALESKEQNKIDDPSEGTYTLNVKVVKPKVTYANLKSNAIHDKSLTNVLASFSTNFEKGKDPNAIYNIKKSARAINGIVLLPGEKFSFQDAIITEKNAHPNEPYHEAIQYNPSKPNGQELAEGGGVCQTSTTLFGAALRANLIITQRYCHSKRVYYVPIGQDAAYDYGSKNLSFVNNRINPIIIRANVNDKSIQVTIYGKKLPSETFDVTVESKTTAETSDKISAVATQIVKQNGAEICRRKFYSTYNKSKDDNKKKVVQPPVPNQIPETAANPNPTAPNINQPTQSAVPNVNSNSPTTAQKPNNVQQNNEKATNQSSKKEETSTGPTNVSPPAASTPPATSQQTNKPSNAAFSPTNTTSSNAAPSNNTSSSATPNNSSNSSTTTSNNGTTSPKTTASSNSASTSNPTAATSNVTTKSPTFLKPTNVDDNSKKKQQSTT